MGFEFSRGARLVDSLYQPGRSTLGECLTRWRALELHARERCYLVVEGVEPGMQQTMNSRQIAELSSSLRPAGAGAGA